MPLDFPVRASVPPLSGVFQQGGTRRAKRPAPCPMHAPAIPAHHEGNGFDLLFLVQAPKSFLSHNWLARSNRLPEEKAGHLYAVCLFLMRRPAAALGLQHQGGRGVDPCLQLAVEHIQSLAVTAEQFHLGDEVGGVLLPRPAP